MDRNPVGAARSGWATGSLHCGSWGAGWQLSIPLCCAPRAGPGSCLSPEGAWHKLGTPLRAIPGLQSPVALRCSRCARLLLPWHSWLCCCSSAQRQCIGGHVVPLLPPEPLIVPPHHQELCIVSDHHHCMLQSLAEPGLPTTHWGLKNRGRDGDRTG